MNPHVEQYRRANWRGLKTPLKRLLGFGPINALLRLFLRGPRWLWIPVNRPEVEARFGGIRFFMRDPIHGAVARELYWGGGRRIIPCEQFALELFCRSARDADVILDVGAAEGVFSLAAAAANEKARVRAFEIVPEIVELLRRNVARNGFQDRVLCHAFGVGVDGATVRLPRVEGVTYPLSFSSDWDVEGGRPVGLRGLDALMAQFPELARCRLVKIDVEGTEDAVFAHGERFFGEAKPDILCEVLPDCAKVDAYEPMLARLGYAFFKVKDSTLERRSRLAPDGAYHDWYLTTRPEAFA